MSIKTDLRSLNRKDPAPSQVAGSPCRLLAGNEIPSTAKALQIQFMRARGLRSTLAILAAALHFGEEKQ